jgi:hypothetical protein
MCAICNDKRECIYESFSVAVGGAECCKVSCMRELFISLCCFKLSRSLSSSHLMRNNEIGMIKAGNGMNLGKIESESFKPDLGNELIKRHVYGAIYGRFLNAVEFFIIRWWY